MARSILTVLAALLLMSDWSAAAAGSLANLESVAIVKGHCSRLVIAGREASATCAPMVINDAYRNGRVGFTFTANQVADISFSGGAEQIKVNANKVSQPLDAVIVTSLGASARSRTERAAGLCTYENPYAGRAEVVCVAQTGSGSYSAAFMSDGRAPDLHRF